MKIIDLTGETFGFLKVEGLSEKRSPQGYKMWACRCQCGGLTYARSWELRRGRRTSCGCGLSYNGGQPRKPIVDAPPATDCFAYKDGECDALKEMLCVTTGKCAFYCSKEEK